MNATKDRISVWIRWMIRRDHAEVLAIEQASSEQPWTEDELLHHLRQRCVIGMVAEHGEKVVGFMVYELSKHSIRLLNIAVHPDYRRRDVGAQMLDRLIIRLTRGERNAIIANVPDNNLGAQLFFRSLGFLATKVLRGEESDTYRMEFKLEGNL